MNIHRKIKWQDKYPDIFDGWQVSLNKVGPIFEIYNKLRKNGDIKTLKLFGLQDFGEDIKEILDPNWLKKERKAKLKKIMKNK